MPQEPFSFVRAATVEEPPVYPGETEAELQKKWALWSKSTPYKK
jgi:hypothetical protein